MITVVLLGTRGSRRRDDVPYPLDAAANGGDQNFQVDGVGEGPTEFGGTPVRAKALVVDLRPPRLGIRLPAGRGVAGVPGVAGVFFGVADRRPLGGGEEFARQRECARWIGVPVAGRAGPELRVLGPRLLDQPAWCLSQ